MMSPHSPVRRSATEPEMRAKGGLPPILNIPNEIMDQVVSELPDGALANFRAAARCIRIVTSEAWKDRAMRNKDGAPVLMWAVKHNYPHLVRYVLTVSPYMELNCPWEGKDYMSPLSIACSLGHNEVVRALVSLGADINYASGAAPKSTSLLYASRSGYHDTVQLLLELGADANALNQEGLSLIHIAAKYNQVKTLQVILDWRIAHPHSMPDVEFCDGSGNTALQVAIAHRALGHSKIGMKMESADSMMADTARGRKALPWVIGFLEIRYRSLILSYLNGLAWENGIRPKLTKKTMIKCGGLLCVTIAQPTLEAVRVLADHGASLDGLLSTGVPATHFAIASRDLELLQLFLFKGWDVNIVDQRGSSAIHVLAQQTYTERFSLLALISLEAAGADMFLRNTAGETPKDLAVLQGWPDDVIKTFLDEDFVRYNENGGYLTTVVDIIFPMLFSCIFLVEVLSHLDIGAILLSLIPSFIFCFLLITTIGGGGTVLNGGTATAGLHAEL